MTIYAGMARLKEPLQQAESFELVVAVYSTTKEREHELVREILDPFFDIRVQDEEHIYGFALLQSNPLNCDQIEETVSVAYRQVARQTKEMYGSDWREKIHVFREPFDSEDEFKTAVENLNNSERATLIEDLVS